MYIAKLKDGPKRVKKIFSMIWKKFSKWYDATSQGTWQRRRFWLGG
jgi:hypothetical protein